MPINQHRFADRALGRKKRVGNVVADYAHVSPTARFDVIEKTAFLEFERRSDEVIRYCSSDQNVADFALAIFHTAQQTRSWHRDNEIRTGRCSDDTVNRLGVLGLYLFAVAIIPPIIHTFPRPLRDVENIVAKNGHAFVEANLYSPDRSAHERDGDNTDNDAERRQG